MQQCPDIKYLFEPRAIAVIGGSAEKGKIGYKIVENILGSGYKGKVYPINPKGGKVLGLKIYETLEQVPGEIDVGVIVIPAKFVFETVRACAAKGVKFLPIITSGFSEVGNIEEEHQMVAFAREHGMRILGPNIFGIYSAKAAMNATFGPKDILPGNVAILTQSGALGIAMIGKSAYEGIGLSSIVSIGNKSDIDEADLLEYLIEDDTTTVILMYLEGVHNGPKFVDMLKKATCRKPIVVLKSGRSKRGAMAAASHTGSLAGSDDIFSDVMKQCGVLRAEDVDEAFNWCMYLDKNPLPKGDNTIIITNGGGIGVMTTDACEKYNIKLYDDIKVLKAIFSKVTPDFGSVKNPIDLTGQASPENYEYALNAALENKDVHTIIGLYCETGVFNIESLGGVIGKAFDKFSKAGKPCLFSLVGGERVEGMVTKLKSEGLPVFNDVYGGVSCLGALYSHMRYIQENADVPETVKIDDKTIENIIKGARADKRVFLLSNESMALAKAAGMSVPKSFVAKDLEEALKRAEEIGYPVVIKIVSKDIIHKSDAGGVALDLQNKQEVIDAYEAVIHNAHNYNPNANITGVEVSEMVAKGTETIVGARRDPSFGPVVMFGLGGIYVEVMKDVAFRALPIGRKETEMMIKEIRSYPLLLGVRGEKRKDIEGVIDNIVRMASIIQRFPDISDIEINPLMAYDFGDGVKAVDIRVLLSKPDGGV
jgi:acetate---CoA ligase (ADP-forming)